MPTVFTTGYENDPTPASLVDRLRDAGVTRLVDVRELPLSRRKGFSKTALAQALEEAGVRYEHVRALGNPKPYRNLYKGGRQEEGEALYRAHIRNGSSYAVDELSERLGDEPTCLLCFEVEHTTCHRDVIVDELRGRLPRLQVRHI